MPIKVGASLHGGLLKLEVEWPVQDRLAASKLLATEQASLN